MSNKKLEDALANYIPTEEEAWAALKQFIEYKHTLHVPPQPTDADMIIGRVIELWKKAEAENAGLKQLLDKANGLIVSEIGEGVAKYIEDNNINIGERWVAKEDCMNNFRRGQVVTITNVNINGVVVDDIAELVSEHFKKHFVKIPPTITSI